MNNMDFLKVLMQEGDKKAEVEAHKINEDWAEWLFQSMVQFMRNPNHLDPITKTEDPEESKLEEKPKIQKRLPLIGGINNNLSSMAEAFKKAGFEANHQMYEEKSNEEDPYRAIATKLFKENEETDSKEEDTDDSIDKPTPEGMYPAIRYVDGVELYRCRYWCKNPVCRNQGNRYIELGQEYVKCHSCKTKHVVRPATGKVNQDGVPETDRWGNFYRADSILEESEEAYPEVESITEYGDEPKECSTLWTSHTARTAGDCTQCGSIIQQGDLYFRKNNSKKRICKVCQNG